MIRLSVAFRNKYPKTARKVLAFLDEATGKEETDFADITKPALSAFVEAMCERLADSSARTYAAQLKAVLNLYSEEAQLPKGWEKVLTIRNDVSEQIYLTDEEVGRIIHYVPDTFNEAVVQQQFVLSCLIGARHGDILRMTENNIRGNFIHYVSEKTHIKAQVPLSDVARRILTGEFCNMPGLYGEEGIERFAYRRRLCDKVFNNTIREICRRCDIDDTMTLYKRGHDITAPKWQFVSSHTGRRTCASLLYLHGCDIYTISRILAHASVEMTAKSYILCPIRQLSEETLAYFTQFK